MMVHKMATGCPACGDSWSDHDRDKCADWADAWADQVAAEYGWTAVHVDREEVVPAR